MPDLKEFSQFDLLCACLGVLPPGVAPPQAVLKDWSNHKRIHCCDTRLGTAFYSEPMHHSVADMFVENGHPNKPWYIWSSVAPAHWLSPDDPYFIERPFREW